MPMLRLTFGGRSIPEFCSVCNKKCRKSCYQDRSHLCSLATQALSTGTTRSLPGATQPINSSTALSWSRTNLIPSSQIDPPSTARSSLSTTAPFQFGPQLSLTSSPLSGLTIMYRLCYILIGQIDQLLIIRHVY